MIDRIKWIFMTIACMMILLAMLIVYLIFAIFSENARWVLDEILHKAGDVFFEGEARVIEKHRIQSSLDAQVQRYAEKA